MQYIVWPIAVLIISIFSILLFRRQIANLISRINKISRTGIETITGTPRQEMTSRPLDVEELMRAFDSASLRERERLISDDLNRLSSSDSENRVRVLVRHLAATQLQLNFERINRIIWGSQINLLRRLNSTGPLPRESAQSFYNVASADPLINENYSFASYLEFLTGNNMVIERGQNLEITQFGKEFLVYLTLTGLDGYRPL